MGTGVARGAAGQGARVPGARLARAARWSALWAVLGGASSAHCHRVFTCTDSTQCHHGGIAGTCEADGFCSFPADDCPSGRRYGEHAAAGVEGACVPGRDDPPPVTTASSDDGSGSAGATSIVADTSGTDDASSTGIAGEDTTHDPCDGLRPSGVVTASADGEVIEGLRIDVDTGPAIFVDGFAGVTIRDCEIHHSGGPGISFRAAPDLRIENVIVVHDGAPEAGPHADGGQVNIEGSDSTGVVIDRVRLERGASGILLESTPAVVVSNLEMHDVRGPGLAACVRLYDSDDAIVEDFSCENPLDTGRPGDLIAVQASSDVTIRRGLLDGHNAEFGVGVRITHTSGQHSGGLVEDVDAIRMTNGAFSCFMFGQFITFRRTRARENICEILSVPIEGCAIPGPNGGCVPNSNAVSWTASGTSHDNVIDDAVAFDLCATPVWPVEPAQGAFIMERGDLVTEDFVLRDPIRLTMCWEAS